MNLRKKTKQIYLNELAVGGDAPISVQTMTKTDTRDIDATVSQIKSIERVGGDIVRLAVIDMEAAKALEEINSQVSVPLIADIHFDCKLALQAIESGVAGLRLNPGNIGDSSKVESVVKTAAERDIPIRIGVNAGSLQKDIEAKYGKTPLALVESALEHIRILENLNYYNIKVSVKVSDVLRTIEAYRLLSDRIDYPLHIGLTEAGTSFAGTIKSSVALGVLLAEGIGDTIRVSLTDDPELEIKTGLEILRSLELREPGAAVTSCPTCGRTMVDVKTIALEVEKELENFMQDNPNIKMPSVAVMGCIVNGPGEAKDVDVALCGGKDKFALYVKGEYRSTIPKCEAVDALIKEVLLLSNS
ncbi:MAG: flavodoxin-dependent (E)-4-hydroxy-3-methylbut-2-enyl-diphosphate synthase [Kiritimatiellae bacterium]|jgi:(E)-4-hydroxy-3-methylbut-2-enyl-diphosphate synthase|nr:flavodoxin-dependent (E)-4-hydroxy-3-methylbut-2-enyl-diphosphate synthase [Kiritimatiellia bacterium]